VLDQGLTREPHLAHEGVSYVPRCFLRVFK